MTQQRFSRRQFLHLATCAFASLAVTPSLGFQLGDFRGTAFALPEFPSADRLGRVLGGQAELKSRPDSQSSTLKLLPEDMVVVWLRQVVGSRYLWNDQRYVETPEGYIYAANLQPVRNEINQPVSAFPLADGAWVEVSVPYVDLTLANPPGRSPWLKFTATPRLYFSQIMWADQIRQDEMGQVLYRVSDRYGGFGDFFWADARAFRLVRPEELSPISPDVENKLIVVNLTYQTLSCLENEQEVYFCQVSTGPKLTSKAKPAGEWATPIGKHTIWRKLVAVHMTGGTTGGGYDLAGIGWTTLFASKGMAIHSTFWHNSFGIPRSHGCVNCKPEDALWIFRWTQPVVPFEIGDLTVSGQGSTKVLVQET